jgi:protein-disulfide isomerase
MVVAGRLMYSFLMLTRRPLLATISLLTILGCGASSAQSPKDTEALKKEVEALKASQAEMRKSLDEIREFLKAATGGRFGSPSLEGSSIEIAGAPSNGPATASVTLVEISDYHCPFCRRHVQQTQPQLYTEYVQSGKVRHVFLHYPIEQLHPDAYRSHEAASCAADQGKFWELHAKLFETPNRTIEQLVPLAQSAGLDAGAFRTCLESGKYAQAVKDSVARIQKLGINGTPAFLIGRTPESGQPMKISKIVEGAQPFAAFKTALDQVLAGK